MCRVYPAEGSCGADTCRAAERECSKSIESDERTQSKMTDDKFDSGPLMESLRLVGGGLMAEVLDTMSGDQLKQQRFMQCMICDRKQDCALSGKPEPRDNKKTGLCSRLLLPGETRSVGETRGRKKGSKPKSPQKYPKGVNKSEDPIRKWLRSVK